MSDLNPLTVPDPGWYPDRSDPNLQRWWDGGQWTDNTYSTAPEDRAVDQPVSASAFGFGSAEPVAQVAAAVPAPAAVPVPVPAPATVPAVAVPVAAAVPAPAAAASIPPGWYPDHRDAAIQRWWDGRGWTAHTAPAAPIAAVADIPNTMATRGFIYSLISLALNPLFIMSIGGLVVGIRGLRRAPQFSPQNARRGYAIAAIAIGSTVTALWILAIVSGIVVYNDVHARNISTGDTGTSAISTITGA